MTEEKIIKRIQDVLRKADSSRNPSKEEREIAMRVAQRLMLKHGLTLADVGDVDQPQGQRFSDESTGIATTGRDDHWRGSLLHGIASVFFVQGYYMSGSGQRRSWHLVGRKDNVEATQELFKFISPQVQNELTVAESRMGLYWRLARTYCKAAAREALRLEGMDPMNLGVDEFTDEELVNFGQARLLDFDTPQERAEDVMVLARLDSIGYAKNVLPRIRAGQIAPADSSNLGVWRRSFLDAAVGTIVSRLRELHKEEVQDLGTSGAELVKNERAALQKFLEESGLRLTSRTSSRRSDASGRQAGRAAGQRADLSGSRKVAGGQGALPSGA